jgi:hypothetical protein
LALVSFSTTLNLVEGHFNLGLFNPNTLARIFQPKTFFDHELFNHELFNLVEKFMVEEFMVEEFMVEKSRVEAWV